MIRSQAAMTELTLVEISVSLSITPSPKVFSALVVRLRPPSRAAGDRVPEPDDEAADARVPLVDALLHRLEVGLELGDEHGPWPRPTPPWRWRAGPSAARSTSVWASSKTFLASAPALARIDSSEPTMPSWRAPLPLTVPCARRGRAPRAPASAGAAMSPSALAERLPAARRGPWPDPPWPPGRARPARARASAIGPALHELARPACPCRRPRSSCAPPRRPCRATRCSAGTASGTAALALTGAVAAAAGCGGIGAALLRRAPAPGCVAHRRRSCPGPSWSRPRRSR